MADKDCNHGRPANVRAYDNRQECNVWPLKIGSGLMVRESTFDANATMSRLSDARCLLECAMKSLDQRQDESRPGSELVCLRYAAEVLRRVYDELDREMGSRYATG